MSTIFKQGQSNEELPDDLYKALQTFQQASQTQIARLNSGILMQLLVKMAQFDTMLVNVVSAMQVNLSLQSMQQVKACCTQIKETVNSHISRLKSLFESINRLNFVTKSNTAPQTVLGNVTPRLAENNLPQRQPKQLLHQPVPAVTVPLKLQYMEMPKSLVKNGQQDVVTISSEDHNVDQEPEVDTSLDIDLGSFPIIYEEENLAQPKGIQPQEKTVQQKAQQEMVQEKQSQNQVLQGQAPKDQAQKEQPNQEQHQEKNHQAQAEKGPMEKTSKEPCEQTLQPFIRQVPCQSCDKKFQSISQLTRHHNSKHVAQPIYKPYKCSFCSQRYNALHYLHTHMKAKHPTELQSLQ